MTWIRFEDISWSDWLQLQTELIRKIKMSVLSKQTDSGENKTYPECPETHNNVCTVSLVSEEHRSPFSTVSWEVALAHSSVCGGMLTIICVGKKTTGFCKIHLGNNLILVCLSSPSISCHLTFWGQAGIDLLAGREGHAQLELSPSVKHHWSL